MRFYLVGVLYYCSLQFTNLSVYYDNIIIVKFKIIIYDYNIMTFNHIVHDSMIA